MYLHLEVPRDQALLSLTDRLHPNVYQVFVAPTRILTDSLSGARVAANIKSAARARPMLWRCAVMHEMARKGAIEVVHVGDEHNPSDYLTKWLKKEKVERSVCYSSGAAHVP